MFVARIIPVIHIGIYGFDIFWSDFYKILTSKEFPITGIYLFFRRLYRSFGKYLIEGLFERSIGIVQDIDEISIGDIGASLVVFSQCVK